MVPSAFVIPASLPPGVLGALLEPTGLVAMLAAVTAAVGLGLVAALVGGRKPSTPHAGSVRPLRALRPSAA